MDNTLPTSTKPNTSPTWAMSEFRNPQLSDTSPVTLIRLPIIFSANSYSTPIALPIGPTYLAATLRKAGYGVHLLDCVGAAIDKIRLTPDRRFKIQGLDEEEVVAAIPKDTDIIGISIMFSQEWPYVRECINRVRAAFPNAKIIVGGEHPTELAEFCLRDCPAIDFVVKGEGELPLLELVHGIRSGTPTSEVHGIAYRENGAYRETKRQGRIEQVGEIPWPAWDLIDLEPYFRPNYTMGISHGRNMAILATRGCPYSCTFCSNATMWKPIYKMRPVSEVIDEIEFYVKKYQANSFDFYDLTAIVKKEWIIEFTSELKRRKLDILWQLPSGTRSEALDKNVIDAITDTGLKFLVYAPESGSERILKMVKKRVTLSRMIESITYAKTKNITVKTNFIIGFPDETRSDVWKTLRFAWKLALMKVDDCNVALFSPYPGGEIYNELRKTGEIEGLTDKYFENLMTQFDFTIPRTVCRNMGAMELLVLRFLGMAVFYSLSYLRCPSRLFRLMGFVIFRKRKFVPNTLFEQRIFDGFARGGSLPSILWPLKYLRAKAFRKAEKAS